MKAAVVLAGVPAIAHELVYIVLGLPMAVYYGLLAWRAYRKKDDDGQH